MDAIETTQEQRVWTIFDIHNTSVVYVRRSYVPWYDGKVIGRGRVIDSNNTGEFNRALVKSQNAVQDQYQLWAKQHDKRVEDLTTDDELEAEAHFVLSGLEQLTNLDAGKRDSVPISLNDATFVVPIACVKEAYREALDDSVVDGVLHVGCVAVISSSTTQQSSAIVRYLLGDELYHRYFETGRLAFVNAVRPNRNLMRDGTTLTLPDFEKPLSKSDSQTWLTAYILAGIGTKTPIVRIYEDKNTNLRAAFNAAQQLQHHPETYRSLVDLVDIK